MGAGWPRVNKKLWERTGGQQETGTTRRTAEARPSKNGIEPRLEPRAEPISWLGLAQLASFGRAGGSRAIAKPSKQ